jgi:hypothetical protein
MPSTEQVTTTASAAGTPAVSTATTGSAMPEYGKMSSSDLEGMINAKPTEDQAAQGISPETKPAVGEEKPIAPAVPDKFKNPDGSVNLDNLIKSYSEAEKKLGQTGNASHENELLKQQIQDLYSEMEQSKALQEELKSKFEMPQEELTQEQLTRKIIREEMMKQEQDSRKQRIADYEILSAINQAREKLPNFKEFEPEIEALSKQTNEFVKQSPKAVELLYNAVVGMKAPELVGIATKKAFQDGYEKAKAEMKMQVEGGGRDTTPVDVGLNASSVGSMSAAELEKILPKMGDNSTRIVY